jgi:hypothetical protein
MRYDHNAQLGLTVRVSATLGAQRIYDHKQISLSCFPRQQSGSSIVRAYGSMMRVDATRRVFAKRDRFV